MENKKLDNKQFDKTVKEKLEHLQAPLHLAAWDRFAERLDEEEKATGQSEPETQTLEEAVYEKLYHYEKPYNPSHWFLFSQRLDEEFSLWHRLYRYKVTEVALMLLLLLTVAQYFPATKILKSNFTKEELPSDSFKTSPERSATLEQAVILPQETQGNQLLQNLATENASLSTIATQNRKKAVAKTKSTTNSLQAEPEIAHEITDEEFTPRSGNISPNIPSLQGKSLEKNPHSLATTGTNEKANTTGIGLRLDNSNSRIGVLTTIPSFTSNILLLHADSYTSLGMETKLNKRPKRLRVGIFASTNVDYIRTPYDEVFDFNPYARYALGYGGGFSIGWQAGRWEFSSGIIYSAKLYKPIPHIVLYDDGTTLFAESLFSVELNTLQVPVHVKYDYVSGEKWHLYAITGASLHSVVQANYDVQRSAINGSDGKPLKSQSSTPKSDILLLKKFADGWFNGGRFDENSYFSVDFGMGVEYYFSHRWSIYVQPTYLQGLNIFAKGIGPNQDRINSTHILLGAKVGL